MNNKNKKNNNNEQTSPPPPYSPVLPNVSGSGPSRSPGPQQQPQYRAIIIEHSTTPVLIASGTERQFPVAALFFIFGWICPFLWIVGACCCAGSWQPYESWWGHANMLMAITFTMASLIYTAVLFATGQIHG
ncbi:hypothetical protein BDA99DRAFT_543220 [Phascolomyces articulosus]|uniref:Uncharacterized protein n=1 Tax=Phascolomyces articulosus TaxID=60185 RepID=A0AAD5K1H0_9FUNG|nr:hypothetical protein BDA99DRAFT_543220 [Phascolomyces articulosus]